MLCYNVNKTSYCNQKGQVLVEFALVLYFFLMLVFGVIYSGMLFYDYNTLSNTARTVARERALTGPEVTNEKILERYVKDGKFVYGMTTSLYQPDNPPITIETTDNDDIIVTISMSIENRSALMAIVLPERYRIRYHMRKDYVDANGNEAGS